ncbi:21679_t:CDS:1, partial [Gigaspora margarita]
IAQDFLAIPAISITSKQMFSCADCIIDNSCALSDVNTIAALMYQKNWLVAVKKFS